MSKNNTIHSDIKNRHLKIYKEQGFKEWLHYFFDYYKWHTLIFITMVIFVISFIISLATSKDIILQVAFINSALDTTEEDFCSDYYAFADIDPLKQEVFLDASLFVDPESNSAFDRQTDERIFLMSSAATLDVLISDESYFPHMAEDGFLMNLRNIFTEEELENMGDLVYYYDSPNDDYEGELPVAIEVSQSPRFKASNCYPDGKAFFSVSLTSKSTSQAKLFYEYLYIK